MNTHEPSTAHQPVSPNATVPPPPPAPKAKPPCAAQVVSVSRRVFTADSLNGLVGGGRGRNRRSDWSCL